MDAYDWCLSCSTYLENNEGPYCSDACRVMYKEAASPPTPTAHTLPSQPPPPFPACAPRRSSQLQQPTPSSSCYGSAYSEDLSLPQHHYQSQHPAPRDRHDSASAWIGKGPKGIYEWTRQVHPGPPPSHAAVDLADDDSLAYGAPAEIDPLRPSLLSAHARSPRRPVPPRLFVAPGAAKTTPAPPLPSRPILAAQTSMPSLVSHSATASLSSLATPGSSARASLHVPSKPASEAGEDEGPPSAETQRPTLFAQLAGRISAHVKTWAAGEHSALVNHPAYSTSHQLHLARAHTPARPLPAQRSVTAATVRAGLPVLPSPVSLYPIDGDILAQLEDDALRSGPLRADAAPRLYQELDDYACEEKRECIRDDHPAFLARGRRAERAVC